MAHRMSIRKTLTSIHQCLVTCDAEMADEVSIVVLIVKGVRCENTWLITSPGALCIISGVLERRVMYKREEWMKWQRHQPTLEQVAALLRQAWVLLSDYTCDVDCHSTAERGLVTEWLSDGAAALRQRWCPHVADKTWLRLADGYTRTESKALIM